MSFIQKHITGKPLWVNMIAAVGLVLLLVLLFFGSLSWLTKYGKTKKVPSVTGQHVAAAIQLLEQQGFDVQIQDSVFVDTLARQAIVRQTPEADALVKSGRTIYLTINRTIAPQVEMPNLTGFSIKSAEMYLQSLGLKPGEIMYKPDIARNSVLEQLFNSAPIAPGTKIPIGSVISLVLGSGVAIHELDIPDLRGMTLAGARAFLLPLGMNIGSVTATGSIKDTAGSYVIRQLPEPFADSLDARGERVPNQIQAGQLINVYINSTASPLRDTLP